MTVSVHTQTIFTHEVVHWAALSCHPQCCLWIVIPASASMVTPKRTDTCIVQIKPYSALSSTRDEVPDGRAMLDTFSAVTPTSVCHRHYNARVFMFVCCRLIMCQQTASVCQTCLVMQQPMQHITS